MRSRVCFLRSLVAAVGVVALSRVIDATSEPAGASESAQPTSSRLATPVLSARRVVDELIEPVGRARLQEALQPLASSMGASSCLRVTIDGDEVIDANGTVPLIPASTLKLLTASVALDVMGPDRTAETTVEAVAGPVGGVIAGDVWLVGGGDPLLATEGYVKQFRRPQEPRTPLEALADSIVAAGITQITGRVLGDESRFDTQRYVPSWPQRYINAREIGPMSALSVNDGFIDTALTPAADPAASARGGARRVAPAAGRDGGGGIWVGRRPRGHRRARVDPRRSAARCRRRGSEAERQRHVRAAAEGDRRGGRRHGFDTRGRGGGGHESRRGGLARRRTHTQRRLGARSREHRDVRDPHGGARPRRTGIRPHCSNGGRR